MGREGGGGGCAWGSERLWKSLDSRCGRNATGSMPATAAGSGSRHLEEPVGTQRLPSGVWSANFPAKTMASNGCKDGGPGGNCVASAAHDAGDKEDQEIGRLL